MKVVPGKFVGLKRPKTRPPRQVWILLCDGNLTSGICLTKRAATELADRCNTHSLGTYTVSGPFVLAERVRQK